MRHELKVFQLDVKSVFLNGKLEEVIYVEQPQGFVVKGKEDQVYRLQMTPLQAPRVWNKKIDEYCQSVFERSPNDLSLNVKKNCRDFLVIFLYVDDRIYFGTNDN